MSYIAKDAGSFAGRVVGNGHCVALVREACGAPHTSSWTRGERVRGSATPAGTAIATFGADRTYQNRTDGASHAAILIAVQPDGLLVWDQWRGHPVARRTIRYKGSIGTANNDGDRFYVIEENV
jgi:hypothetical protein